MNFKIGDLVKYRKIKGEIIDIEETISSYGDMKGSILHYLTIKMDSGHTYVDYFYVFERDIESERNQKIDELLKCQ